MKTNALTLMKPITNTFLGICLAATLVGAPGTVRAAESTTPPAAAGTSETATPILEQSQAEAAPAKPKRKVEPESLLIKAMTMGIPIVAIVMGIGIGFFAIWVDYKKRRDLLAFYHQERMAALEKGLELPPFPAEMFGDGQTTNDCSTANQPERVLKSGLFWLGGGIGLAIFLSFQGGRSVHPAVAAIPIGIGIARLVYFSIVRNGKSANGMSR